MENQVIYQFGRNENDVVCVSRGKYRDKSYIDFRIFYTDRESGDLRPTKKGITISEDLLPHLKKAVLECEQVQLTELKQPKKGIKPPFNSKG